MNSFYNSCPVHIKRANTNSGKWNHFFALLACSIAGIFSLSAQLTLKEGSFRLRPNDTEILINRNTPQERVKITDDNGEVCALIKIFTENMTEADREIFINPKYRETDRATFITKIETDHVNEIWIFLSPGASYMVLKHPDYGNCKFDFTAMGVTLLSAKVYEATITGDRKVYETILARNAKASTGDEDKYQYLVISANPSNAEIYINGEFSGTGEASKRMPMGMRHAYRVEAPMYHSQEGTLEISERTTLPITLKPAFGYVTVITTPESGADVYIDNELLGETPLESDKRLVSGEHTLRVSKRNFRPIEQKIHITDDTRLPVNIDLSATFANLSISAGQDVAIYIDGEKVGDQSWSGRLSEGSHFIEGRKTSHVSSKLDYQAKAGVSENIVLEAPVPIYGKLDIGGSPTNARVSLNGQDIGYSPDIFSNILIGNYDVRLTKEGYIPQTHAITIEEGKTTRLNFALEIRKTIPVVVELESPVRLHNVSLSIDGEPKGASFSGELNVGTRQVRAQYNGFTEDFVIKVSPEGSRHFKLPVTARVQFHSLPDKAVLSVDGQERGQTPLLLRLPLGKHSIRMEKDQLSTDRNIQLHLGDDLVETYTLRKYNAYSFVSYVASYQAPLGGLMYGYCRNWGFYAKAQINFQQQVDAITDVEEYAGLPKQYMGVNRLSVTLGGMKRLSSWMYMYMGAGYGEYEPLYSITGYYEYFSPLPVKGPEAEIGMMLKWKGLTLSAGYGALVPLSFDTNRLFTDVHLGLGFTINHH